MTRTEAIANIKKLLGFDAVPPAPAPVAPAAPATTDYTLADGVTVVSIDKMEVGGNVTIAGAPAPDGTITLVDGTAITTAGGVITTLVPPTPVEAPVELKTQKEINEALQKFADGAAPDQQSIVLILRALFENVFGWEIRQAKEKAVRDQAIAAYQQGFQKQQDAFKSVLELLEEISKEEITKPVETPQKDWDKMTPLEQFRAQKQK